MLKPYVESYNQLRLVTVSRMETGTKREEINSISEEENNVRIPDSTNRDVGREVSLFNKFDSNVMTWKSGDGKILWLKWGKIEICEVFKRDSKIHFNSLSEDNLDFKLGNTEVRSSLKWESDENRFKNQLKLEAVAERGVVADKVCEFLNKFWKSVILYFVKRDGLRVWKKFLANWEVVMFENFSLSHKLFSKLGIKFEEVLVNWRVLEIDDNIWFVFLCNTE